MCFFWSSIFSRESQQVTVFSISVLCHPLSAKREKNMNTSLLFLFIFITTATDFSLTQPTIQPPPSGSTGNQTHSRIFDQKRQKDAKKKTEPGNGSSLDSRSKAEELTKQILFNWAKGRRKLSSFVSLVGTELGRIEREELKEFLVGVEKRKILKALYWKNFGRMKLDEFATRMLKKRSSNETISVGGTGTGEERKEGKQETSKSEPGKEGRTEIERGSYSKMSSRIKSRINSRIIPKIRSKIRSWIRSRLRSRISFDLGELF